MRTLITHGALMGWKREPAEHGVVLTVQIAASAQAAAARDYQEVGLALNDRQLRSLTRDLMRALNERGLDAFSPTPLWLQLGEWLWPGKRNTGALAAGRSGDDGSNGT